MAGTELEPAGQVAAPHPVHPTTGEAVELSAPDDVLARALDEAKELKGLIGEFERAIKDELLRRMDREASWTRRAGGGGGPAYKLEGDTPQAEEYDADKLVLELKELVLAEVIDPEAAEAAVGVEYKAKKAGINKLKKLGGVVAEALERCKIVKEKSRNVKVSIEHDKR